MTHRKFNKGFEDPTGVVRESALNWKYARNQDYIDAIDDAQSFQNAQEDAITQINTQARYLSKQYGLEAMNGTNWTYDVRKTYAQAFRQAQESMTMSMNASYGDKFVFGGAAGGQPPFDLRTEADGTKTLLYRGLDVNHPDAQDDLSKMANEQVFTDLGFGLTMEGNNVVNSSAFNTSLPGINVVGYGVDDNGNSKNLISLAGEIADVLDQEDFDEAKYKELLNAFDDARGLLADNLTTIGTRTNFLENTKDRLEDQQINLTEQYDNVVNVDMAEAITEFSWAQYAYNAALKIGTNILSPSFIDFMS
jgi:flagellar hook-associated protein 3 FlgL